MLHSTKSVAHLIQGSVFAAAILLAPSAFAHGYGDASYGYSNNQELGVSYRMHHRHHHLLKHAAKSRSHEPRYMAAAYRHEDALHEATYGESRYHRARMMRASDTGHASHAALEARREELEAADERERPVTAELNLVQLRNGRERAAEMAEWQLRYGSVASAKAPSTGG